MVKAFWRAFRDFTGQLARPSGRAAWRQDFRMLPCALRWALPWAVLGRVSRDANPMRWLERHARQRPSDVALSTAERQWSFVELHAEVQQRARQLSERGLAAGSQVAMLLPTEPALVITLLACWQLGAIACPLDPASPATQLTEILERLAPDWLIVGKAAPNVTWRDERLIRVEQLVEASVAWAASVGRGPTGHVRIAASAVAMILPTSGTEGSLKLCRVTAGRLALSGHAMGALALDCRRHDVIYCPLPLQHATGVTVAPLPALVHGVALYLPGKFSASSFWDELSRSRATQLIYVGDLLRVASARWSTEKAPPKGLRRLVGNGLDASAAALVQERLSSSRIVEFYGATEAPSLLLNYHGRLGAIGRVPWRALSRFVVVRDAADATESSAARWNECAPGEVGELWIRIPRGKRPYLGDFEGYLDQRDAQRALTENALAKGDYYFRTRDLVRYDADDFFYFIDRLGDVWRSNGHNVSTTWLATRLREVAGIQDACATAIAIDDSSRRIGLAVVVTNGSDWRAGYAAAVLELPTYARPQLVQVLRELPRTATSKTNKTVWRCPLWQPPVDTLALYVWNDGLIDVSAMDWATLRATLLSGKNA
ncbi:MAG TPA: AMP-binding protein [Polyangiaceae bacterium]